MGGIVRVGVTFPSELLAQFDELIRGMGYSSRSKAIHDSVRAFVAENRWLEEQKGRQVGVLTMVYDHDVPRLEESLTDEQHAFSRAIRSSSHVHLDSRNCLEAIVLEGYARDLRRLVNALKSKRGVKEVKLTVVSR